MAHHFILLTVSFTEQKFWILMKFSLSINPFMDCAFSVVSEKLLPGFPGGAVVKNPPANAGDRGSSPGPERSHMPQSNEARAPQLLSLCSRAREPQLLSPWATTTEARMPRARAPQQEKPPQWEARAPQRRVAPARPN